MADNISLSAQWRAPIEGNNSSREFGKWCAAPDVT
jgi:hypothetical protein